MTKKSFFLLLLLNVSSTLYFLSDELINPFFLILVVFIVQAPMYFLLPLSFNCKKRFPVLTVFLLAITMRIIILPSPPLLEDDFYRYLWDGHVQANKINPYEFAPSSPFLDSIHTDYRANINYFQFKTIYPPLAQYFFRMVNNVKSHSLITLKIGLIIFDLLTGFVLYCWLVKLNKPATHVVYYLFNPLVLKEFANSAHIDALAVFLFTLSLYLMSQRSFLKSWMALALSMSVKLFPIILIPYWYKVDRHRNKNLTLALVVFGALYLPFLDAKDSLFHGLSAFSRYWTFNDSFFSIINKVVTNFLKNNSFLYSLDVSKLIIANNFQARIAVFLMISFLVLVLFKVLNSHKQVAAFSLYSLLALLCFSPVFNPWYLTWILPVAALFRFQPALILSFLIILSYSWYYDNSLYPYLKTLEFVIFYLLLLIYFLKKRFLWGQKPEESI